MTREDHIQNLLTYLKGFSFCMCPASSAYWKKHWKEIRESLSQRWIPCESITEPIDREVLCCDKYGNELIGWLDYNDSEECWVCESDECIMYDTIAYMEKPKSYEGRTE